MIFLGGGDGNVLKQLFMYAILLYHDYYAKKQHILIVQMAVEKILILNNNSNASKIY